MVTFKVSLYAPKLTSADTGSANCKSNGIKEAEDTPFMSAFTSTLAQRLMLSESQLCVDQLDFGRRTSLTLTTKIYVNDEQIALAVHTLVQNELTDHATVLTSALNARLSLILPNVSVDVMTFSAAQVLSVTNGDESSQANSDSTFSLVLAMSLMSFVVSCGLVVAFCCYFRYCQTKIPICPAVSGSCNYVVMNESKQPGLPSSSENSEDHCKADTLGSVPVKATIVA